MLESVASPANGEAHQGSLRLTLSERASRSCQRREKQYFMTVPYFMLSLRGEIQQVGEFLEDNSVSLIGCSFTGCRHLGVEDGQQIGGHLPSLHGVGDAMQ